jgi:hypothetical protein
LPALAGSVPNHALPVDEARCMHSWSDAVEGHVVDVSVSTVKGIAGGGGGLVADEGPRQKTPFEPWSGWVPGTPEGFHLVRVRAPCDELWR